MTYSAETGQFNCPGCEERRDYQHKRVRRFFTLYFIPVIPLDMLGEYVECKGCLGTYKLEVLSFDPQAGKARVEAEFQSAMKRIMVLMMLADGRVDDSEVETVQKIYGQLSGKDVARADVEREVELARADGRGIQDYVRSLKGSLNDGGKEMVVKAALCVAAADGEFQKEEREMLARIATELEMSAAHFKGLLAEMTSS